MNEREMFEKSIRLWGLNSQFLMLAEEAAELSVATLHLNRAIKDKVEAWEDFAEEIADVEFMIAEMKDHYAILAAKVNNYRIIKAERLEKLLQGVKVP